MCRSGVVVDPAARWQIATEHSDGGGGLGGVGVGKAHRRLVNRDDILAKGTVSTRGGRPAVRQDNASLVNVHGGGRRQQVGHALM